MDPADLFEPSSRAGSNRALVIGGLRHPHHVCNHRAMAPADLFEPSPRAGSNLALVIGGLRHPPIRYAEGDSRLHTVSSSRDGSR